jgi:hypothetical protein
METAELITSVIAVISALGAIFIAIFKDKFSNDKKYIDAKSALETIQTLSEQEMIQPEQVKKLIIEVCKKGLDQQ